MDPFYFRDEGRIYFVFVTRVYLFCFRDEDGTPFCIRDEGRIFGLVS